MKKQSGFTLIELLIVVAIIAILAAIAVPNFLEAQTRAKVSRTKADMRSVATAMESYRVDTNHYPPPYGVKVEGVRDSWAVLSTPIAYLTVARMQDPFTRPSGSVGQVTLTYEACNSQNQMLEVPATAPSISPAGQTAVWWWIASRGPDKRYGFQNNPAIDPETSLRLKFANSDTDNAGWLTVVYDPTNGTVSLGNIYRAGGQVGGFAGRTMLAQ
ncbi:MAG TPA: prepilin-type N-terminal cleavage/methylation domain-containing protein [Candidatus Sumerlaeota bacterium]|nr:prepilin-type N-terminal cleavage/methylation domain-containing protein [Candidatus Sumerlaeota bacterium]HMZ51525.1 prepilin-type N-terminal cleavage/methylation domain-containing protein [Candidatus Sumerlaeota bacterium]HNM45975.1 prepilin-type N-terminal cleavage/methylation domain-containing protein [Candidatus Sumerlaeota bacterium]